MMNPDDVQDKVCLAFCMEALSEKEGCTTRYVDLPGKPLENFLISGILSARYFRFLAQDILDGKDPDLFGYFVPALKASKLDPESKTLNFGLLEVMFPTVYSRMISEDQSEVFDNINRLMKRENPRDITHLIEARNEGWKTAQKPKINFTGDEYVSAKSPYDCYMIFMDRSVPTDGGYQFSNEYKMGFPTMKIFFNDFRESTNLLIQVQETYSRIRQAQPDLKVGVIADMCAAALFLHLSYRT